MIYSANTVSKKAEATILISHRAYSKGTRVIRRKRIKKNHIHLIIKKIRILQEDKIITNL
jgi:hypothetical protein